MDWIEPTCQLFSNSDIILLWYSGWERHKWDTTQNFSTETMYSIHGQNARFSNYLMKKSSEHTGYAGEVKIFVCTGSIRQFPSWWGSPYSYVWAIINENDCLKDLPLSQNAFFSEKSQLALILVSVLGKNYEIFGFGPIQNLHLGMSKLLNECTFKFISSDRVIVKPSGVERQRRSLSQMRVSILHRANSLLAATVR